jgi:hypothetical protein
MKYKPGVVLPLDMDVRMFIAFDAVRDVFALRGHLGEPVITSVADGKHSSNSYHYKGRAFDLRTKSTGSARFIEAELKERLSHLGFDVVLEDLGGRNEHIHVELDKRADARARREAAKVYGSGGKKADTGELPGAPVASDGGREQEETGGTEASVVEGREP